MPRKIQPTKFFNFLFALLILSIPLNNALETLAMMRGQMEWGGWARPLTPIHIKLIKDAIVAAMLAVTFAAILSRRKIPNHKTLLIPLNTFLIIFLLITVYSAFTMPIDLVAIGIRAYWVILLFYAGAYFHDFNERLISKLFFAVFIPHFILQIIQFVTGAGYPVFGEHRSPGLLLVPSTAGAFALLAYYFSSQLKSKNLKLISIVSVLLSTSTIAVLSISAYLSYAAFNKFKRNIATYLALFLTLPTLATLFLTNIETLSGRGDAVYTSIFTRTNYIKDILSDISNLAFGKGMGIATSQAVMSGMDGAIVADNTFTGGMVNLGFIAMIFLFAFVVMSFNFFKNKILFILFFGYAMISNIFEMTPVIQILMIILGAHYSKYVSKPTSYAADKKAYA